MAYFESWRQNTTDQNDPTWKGFQDYTGRMQGYGSGLMGGVMAGAPIGGSGQLQGQYRADPNGPGVRNYMSNIMGGQRQSVNDYTSQAYAAGMAGRRGGTGVVGGQDPLGQMHMQANQALARGYGDRFQGAMNNEWRGADQALNAWKAQGSLGSEYSGRELAGRQAGADWEWKMYQDDLAREKLAEDTRRWNLQWGRGTEDWNRQRQWGADDRRQQQYLQQQQQSQAQAAANSGQAQSSQQMQALMRDIAMRRLQDQAQSPDYVPGQTWRDYLGYNLTGQTPSAGFR